MAGALKGITVEIGGDTTKLGTALKGVQAQTRSLQSELRGVNTLLKLDPGNVSLLTQKQQLLTKAIGETKTKLDTLKEAQRQIDNGKVEATEEQYRDLEREIAKTEQELKRLEQEQRNFGSVGAQQIAAVGAKWQEMGGKIKDVGTKLAPVSAAFAAMGAASVSAAYSLEKSLSKVQALSGATAEEMQTLESKAREMGASTVYSATDAADAFGYMALAGWNTGQMCDGIRPVLNLAAASEMDLARASDIVTDYTTAFGISAKDAGKFVDQMAYAQAHSNTNTEQLAEAYKNCAATAHSMGYSVEDTTAVLMTMANAGVKGGEAGTALSAIMTRLATDTKGCASELSKYGVEVFNEKGEMNDLSSILTGVAGVWNQLTQEEQAALAKTIAGTDHYSKFATIMSGLSDEAKASGMSFEDYAAALADCDGAAQEMADTMTDNLYGQVEALKSALGEAAISIGQALMPAIKALVAGLQGLVDMFNNLPDGVKTVIAVIITLLAALAPVLIIIGSLMGAIGSIMTYAPMIVTAFGAVATFITGTLIPGITGLISTIVALVGWPALIVAAVVAAITVLYNTCTPFREFVDGLVQAVIGFFQNLATKVVEFFTVTIPAAIQSFIAFFQGIPAAISGFIQSIIAFFQQLPYNLGVFVGQMIGHVVKFVLRLVQFYTVDVPNFINGAIAWFAQLPGKIWNAIVAAITNIANWGTQLFNTATQKVTALVNSVTTFFASLPGKIASAVAAAPGKIASMCSSMASTAASGIATVGRKITSGLRSIVGQVGSIGSNIVHGLWNGISGAAGWLAGQVRSFASGILAGMKSALGIHSPSRAMRDEVGQFIPAGVGEGIMDNMRAALDPMDEMSEELLKTDVSPTIERDIEANFSKAPSETSGIAAMMGEALELLDAIKAKGAKIVMDSGALVGEIIDDVDRELGTKTALAERGL